MPRRKITQEAEQQAEEEAEESEREQLTQRMPKALLEDVDEWAESHGMSRNAAINFMAREFLKE